MPTLLTEIKTSTSRTNTKEDIRYAIGSCQLGNVLVAASKSGICAVLFGDTSVELTGNLAKRFPQAKISESASELQGYLNLAASFLDNPAQASTADLPLDLRGTPFQQKVWKVLQNIPLGETISYGELAERIGNPGAVRAVATACASNPVAVIVPCHRVLGGNGSLTGYRWGLERKRTLLSMERQNG